MTLPGRLGTAEARGLWQASLRLADTGRDVLVECRDLEQVGGAALQVLLALAAELRRRGARLALRGASPAVVRAVTLAGLSGELLGT